MPEIFSTDQRENPIETAVQLQLPFKRPLAEIVNEITAQDELLIQQRRREVLANQTAKSVQRKPTKPISKPNDLPQVPVNENGSTWFNL